MSFTKLLIVLAIAGGGYHYWTKRQEANTVASIAAAQAASPTGFIELPPATGGNPAAVTIVAPENCPEEGARRADSLADDLARKGIPVARAHNVNFSIPNNDMAVANKVMAVMQSEIPIVLVNGKAKSNPQLEEVLAEYRAMKR